MTNTIVCGHCRNDLILHVGDDVNRNKSSWTEVVVYTAVISLSSVLVYEKGVEDMIFAPRYQLIDEYNLMHACVSKIDNYFQQKSQVCACAIEETQKEIHRPFGSPNQEFETVFLENLRTCNDNKTR